MGRPIATAILASILAAACQAEPTGTPRLSPVGALSQPGDSVTIQAVDRGGTWGSITLRRGDTTGGYPTDAISPDSYIIEVHVSYNASREPRSEFGVGDWGTATAADLQGLGTLLEPAMPADPGDFDPSRQPLGTYPGATEVGAETIEGMLYIEVPREFATDDLVLVYRPAAVDRNVALISIWRAGVAPSPVPTATPVPTPGSIGYVAQPGLPFTVIDDTEADGLFASPNTCTSAEGGFSVPYPSTWFTNEPAEDVPTCSYFSPVPFEVIDPKGQPADVAVAITVFEGALGSFNAPDFTLNEEVVVGGFAGWRREQVGTSYEGGGYQAEPPSYWYSTVLSASQAEGPTLRAMTWWDAAGDYDLNKAVLDRMMAGFRVLE